GVSPEPRCGERCGSGDRVAGPSSIVPWHATHVASGGARAGGASWWHAAHGIPAFPCTSCNAWPVAFGLLDANSTSRRIAVFCHMVPSFHPRVAVALIFVKVDTHPAL